MKIAPCLLLLPLIAGFVPSAAMAHPESLSTLRLAIQGDPPALHATLTLPVRDLSKWFPPRRYTNYLTEVSQQLQRDADALLEIRCDGSAALKTVTANVHPGQAGFIIAELKYPLPANLTTIEVRSTQLPNLPNDHQQVATIEDARGAGEAKILAEETLNVQQDTLAAELTPSRDAVAATPASPFLEEATPASQLHKDQESRRISFFLLGVEHILKGYDHLLFLAALLLVVSSFAQAARVITFFTIAHSLTLALAATNVVRLSGRIVEPAIAASIVYVAVENIIVTGQIRARWAIVFAFGLIHGLGFASVLRDLGLGSGAIGVVRPLLGFNLGVEAGQLAVASLLLPLILLLKRRPAFAARWVPACSLLIGTIGGIWLVQRIVTGG